MNLSFIWQAIVILFAGFCLLRITGKKTVREMTGLEIITLLAMASVIGHAVSEGGLWETLITLCVFVALLIAVQYLAVKFDWAERWFMGKATLVIQNGVILKENLKKLRMSVDQLEAQLRVHGITSYADIQSATIEMSGQLGYEWKRQAKPVTVGELEKLLAEWQPLQAKAQPPQAPQPKQQADLFREVVYREHEHPIPQQLE